MRDLFMVLFEKSHFNTGISVTAFSIPHIIYIILIAGGIVWLWYSFKNKSDDKKKQLLDILVYALVISYLTDFFMHDFVYGDGLNMDKLPFHICTVLCPIVAFTQFNKHFKKFVEPVSFLAIVGPLMYLVYPASIGDGEPWCYQAVQTMFYHGVLMAWGILNIALKTFKPELKNCWKAAIGLVIITLWAKLGNTLYEDYNWFFLEEDAFYIGLVANGIIPKWVLMIATPLAVFLVVLAIYGIYYAIMKLKNKTKN